MSPLLSGRRVFVAGRLVGISKRNFYALVRRHGGVPARVFDERVDLILVGEAPPADEPAESPLGQALSANRVDAIDESEFWQQLGLVEGDQNVHQLYTTALLANLLGVPVVQVRRWHRRGLLHSTRQVGRLAYFDFREVQAARRLAELARAGASQSAIEHLLTELAAQFPGVPRPLADLPLVVSGRQLLIRAGEALLEPGGQRHFDFDADASPAESFSGEASVETTGDPRQLELEEILAGAAELEEQGDLLHAAEWYRAAMAAGGSRADVAFSLAEVLYRQGELSAARERYYQAIELDEDFVEARANLGCLLSELGERELALAAFEGALASQPDYLDARYHLARTLDELGRRDEAAGHWQAFLAQAPDSPWADEAAGRLGLDDAE